jgi:hypothetical protein
MAWTNIADFVHGELVDETDLNTMRDNLTYLYDSGVSDIGGGQNPLPLLISDAFETGTVIDASPQTTQTGTATAKPQIKELWYGNDRNEGMNWNFTIPPKYIDTPKINVRFYIATSDTAARTVIFNAQVATFGNGDADIDHKEFAATNAGSTAINGAAFQIEQTEITLTNDDNMAANDQCCLYLWRDSNADTCIREVRVTSVNFSYNG